MHPVRIAAALLLALSLAGLAAPAAAIEAGKDYALLSPPQPTDSRGKVEVIEFFSYKCPHCFDLEPDLEAWAKTLPKNVVLKREPVIFSDSWESMARVYFALESLGAVRRLHGDVFNAIHLDGMDLSRPDDFFDWGAKHGLDRARLKAAYNSFAAATRVARAKQLQRAYRIDGVPALAVNGKYVTSASLSGSNANTLKVVDELVRQESRAGAK